MCILTYGINFLLLYFSWLIRQRFDQKKIFTGLKLDLVFLWQLKRRTFPVFFMALCCGALLLTFFPAYWSFPSDFLARDMPSGTTEEGYPWIGAETPLLEITEYADYQCFQCKKMHLYLRRLMAENPTKIRLVHRHFPMDDKYNPLVKEKFHVGSGIMALLATYAHTEGKFWAMNDVLYRLAGNIDELYLKELAETVGLNARALASAINDRYLRYKVKHDISSGLQIGINGTPAYVIENEVYIANVPQQILKRVLEN
jgi:predicted DsbA family dithiol-disulfide isomerase